MKIIIHDTLNGKKNELEVEPTTTVDVLKLKISAAYNVNYNLLKVSFNNTILKNASQTMQSLGIVEGNEIAYQSQTAQSSNSFIKFIRLL
jgi:hypothetical protein